MKLKDIKLLMKNWKEEEKAAAIGTYSRITKRFWFYLGFFVEENV